MPADYAGAVAAIKTRFIDNWKTGDVPITPVGMVNEGEPPTTDPSDSSIQIPWVLFEIVHTGSYVLGAGTPGNKITIYDGLIKGHVFVPVLDGDSQALALAIAIGEIFRNRLFYDDVTPGRYVRSGYDLQGQPRIDQGDVTSDDGKWFAITATIPFEFWTRA